MKRKANNVEEKDNWKIKLKRGSWERVCEISMPFDAPLQFVVKALEERGYSIVENNPFAPVDAMMIIQFGL